jgi:hypothetical protein
MSVDEADSVIERVEASITLGGIGATIVAGGRLVVKRF